MKLEFSRQIFEKKAQIPSFIKIRLVRAELFHADGQTDMKLVVGFRNFANAPYKERGLRQTNGTRWVRRVWREGKRTLQFGCKTLCTGHVSCLRDGSFCPLRCDVFHLCKWVSPFCRIKPLLFPEYLTWHLSQKINPKFWFLSVRLQVTVTITPISTQQKGKCSARPAGNKTAVTCRAVVEIFRLTSK